MPYAYGAVDLPEMVRLKTLFSGDLEQLGTGKEVELKFIKIYEDEEAEYLTYSFAPVGNSSLGEQ